MTRPKKQTVDYFPHDCNHGKTLFILEQKYGNDGYAFWFKLLELIGSTENHCLDCDDKPTWEYLLSRAHIKAEIGWEIMNLLANLGAIDSELWETHIVWSENFIKRVSDAYRNRISEIPKKPVNLRQKSQETPHSDVENPQTKLKESKRKENKPIPSNGKSKPIPLPPDFKISEATRQWAEQKGYGHLEDYLEYFRDWAVANGKRYLDWEATFRNCIRGDWGKVSEQKQKDKEARAW